MGLAAEFLKYFSGFEKAYGEYTIKGKDDKKGKTQGQAYTRQKPTTEALWKKHLEGKVGLGIPPLRKDNTLLFAAIDVDEYPLNLESLSDQIKELKLPLILCRSKSGGAHLYIFFSEPIKSRVVRGKLKKWAKALGYADTEVFPKQDEHYGEESMGNWINMPYFNANDTDRFAIVEGKQLKALQFLKYVSEHRISETQLKGINVKTDDVLDGAPPCIQKIYTTGLDTHSQFRDKGLVNIGVFLKNKYPDDWEDKFWDYVNSGKIENFPPAQASKIAQSLIKTNYFYQCKELEKWCDKAECLRAEFGIGGQGPGFEINTMTKYEDPTGELIRYELRLDSTDKKIVITAADDLFNFRRFRVIAATHLNMLPNQCKDTVWTGMVNTAMSEMAIKNEEADSTDEGILATQYFTSFLKQQTENWDNLLMNRPVIQDGRYWFIGKDLMAFLKQNKVYISSLQSVTAILRRFYKTFKTSSTKRIKGERVRVWSIETEEIELQDESFDTPEIDTGDM